MNGYRFWVALISGMFLAGTGFSLAWADETTTVSAERVETEASVLVGYRGISAHGEPGRALEYDSLKSSPLFNVNLFTDQGPYHLNLDMVYLNDEDLSANVHLETTSLVKFDLRTERFFHNLDHIPYITRPAASLGTTPRVDFSDQNPADTYGLRLDLSEAKARIKCPDYPAHFNISYWRYEKEGEKQLRFVDENCAGACHMQSKSRKINQVTEEVKASIDAHAGFVDVVLETLFRTFRNRESTPVDDFNPHSRGRLAGSYEHDEDPESRLKETTLRLNTAPSGGVVGSASFTIGERENRSDLTSIEPVEAETDYTKTAADVTYTPNQNWTFNLRYRLLDMDRDSNTTIATYGSTRPDDLDVREAMDVTRAWYEATASYRPTVRTTLKAEFRREEIDRSNTGSETHAFHTPNPPAPIEINESWQLPDEEIVTRVKLGFTSRLLEKSALKLSGWLAIQNNDDPAYGTSFEEGKELFLSASYNPSGTWGILANLNLLSQENDGYEIEGFRSDTYEFTTTFELEREKEQQNFNLGVWLIPAEGLSFDLNYGYMRTSINQDLLIGKVTDPYNYAFENEGVDYTQTVQTITAGVTWQIIKDISCRAEGYHIRSKASFAPDFALQGPFFGNGAFADSADLEDISKVDIVQNGIKGRVDWKIDENLTCGLEATFDDYDEKGNDVFDGSVQSYMASLSYTF